MNERLQWTGDESTLALSKRCELAGVSRAVVYDRANRTHCQDNEEELTLLRLLDEEYTRHPFYGTRRMRVYLQGCGYVINRKRVQRLMRTLGLEGMAPGINTSKAHPNHKVYPYLLRGVQVTHPNHVWGIDITYVRLAHGFVYLVAIMDWYSRKVLAWRISNTMDVSFCIDCLEDAIQTYGAPEIFNSDQGSQFTSDVFTNILKQHQVTISMDGRGRALDNIFVERLWRNVKYEDVYLKKYERMSELLIGLTQYFVFYNQQRPHQSLDYLTPDHVYLSAKGGGAMIVDKFTNVVNELSATSSMGQRQPAAVV
jgi:putative transposase